MARDRAGPQAFLVSRAADSRQRTFVLDAYREERSPATNQQIADEVHVSVAPVKTPLRTLFEKFAIGDLPQNQKRGRLAVLAFERGLVSKREFAARA